MFIQAWIRTTFRYRRWCYSFSDPLNQHTRYMYHGTKNCNNENTILSPNHNPKTDITKPDFGNIKQAYRNKSFGDLFRAYLIYSLCASDWIVNNHLKIFRLSRRIFGQRAFNYFMKNSLCRQFMGGENKEELIKGVKKNIDHGIIPMICFLGEELHGNGDEISQTSNIVSRHDFFQQNKESVLHSLDVTAELKNFSSDIPWVCSKMTLLEEHKLFEDGTKLVNFNTALIQRSAESSHIDLVAKEVMDVVKECMEKSRKLDVFNKKESTMNSAMMNLHFHMQLFELCCKHIQEYKARTSNINGDISRLLEVSQLVTEIGQKAENLGVNLFWDAEQTYLQPIMDVLCVDAMRICNRNRPVVRNTYQCYLKDAFEKVTRDIDIAKEEVFCWGGKIVRGAYMEEERKLAHNDVYEDPINQSYEATTQMYYSVVEHILDEIQMTREGQNQMTIATHNESTVKHILQRMDEKNIATRRDVSFAQIKGMRDHISYALGLAGIPVAKLTHYGSVEHGTAWLSRRVNENRKGVPTANYERELLKNEIWGRLSN